jgi:hypothetical protein
MSQTAYEIQAARAFAGMLADNERPNVISRSNEESSVMKFGRGVIFGTDPENQVLFPSDAADLFAGVVIHRHQTQRRELFATGGTGGETGLQEGEPGDILRAGRVWVEVEEAVAVGDAVYCRHADGAGGTIEGQFRTDADTASAFEVTGAAWVSETAGAGLAILELNLP